MNQNKYNIIGLMSGSSLDGLDIAYCEFDYSDPQNIIWDIKAAKTYPYTEKWQLRLGQLPFQPALIYAKTHTYFGHYMGELVNQFIEETLLEPDFIASHGHTIFHYPEQMMTAQIGDAAALAAKTGYPVIADFRTQDIALKGEGTPLAPVVDQYLFSKYDFLLNLGGIANLTYQHKTRQIAYDVSPCNQVLNALINLIGAPFDEGGKVAANGKPIPDLITKLHQFPFFQKKAPKSLDNQFISNTFLPKVFEFEGEIQDKLHSCCLVFGQQIAQNIQQLQETAHAQLLITGGGAYHNFLIQCIQNNLPNTTVHLPNPQIIEYKEALLMALLGLLRLKNNANCFAHITAAQRDSIGGAIYQGFKKYI